MVCIYNQGIIRAYRIEPLGNDKKNINFQSLNASLSQRPQEHESSNVH
jgi:hypothetical protein